MWNKFDTIKPIATELGRWDGRKSDVFLGKDYHGTLHLLTMYEGYMDGAYFCDLYDTYDNIIDTIAIWCEIPL